MNQLKARRRGFTLANIFTKQEWLLGRDVNVVLRNMRTHTGGGVNWEVYLLELIGDFKTHKFSSDVLVELYVSENHNANCRVVSNIFMDPASHGQLHTLKIHTCGSGPVLAVNGLVWDQKLIHIKDIVG